ARHFLVQRRTEVGAIEWEDTHTVWHPLERCRFTRHDEQLGIIRPFYGKPVGHIPILLEVGHMEINLITQPYAFDDVWSEVRPDGSHVYPYDVTLAFYACLGLTICLMRVCIGVDVVNFQRFVHQHLCRYRMRIVRLTDGREIEKQFHFIAADVKQLGT